MDEKKYRLAMQRSWLQLPVQIPAPTLINSVFPTDSLDFIAALKGKGFKDPEPRG